MSGIEAGIPLVEDELGDALDGGIVCWFKARVDQEPTHRAYPVEYARRLEAVVAAARRLDIGPMTFRQLSSEQQAAIQDIDSALDALAAAKEAGDA